jgi:hypothetical protein
VIVVAGITFAVIVLGLIVVLLLRRQLREKYATLWLVIGLALLVISIFPGLLVQLTHLLGVEVPANLIFAISIALLVGVALHLSWELSRAEEEIRSLAEESAINRADLEALTRRIAHLESARAENDSIQIESDHP